MRTPGLHGPAIGRRGFLALGGAGLGGLALAGCGTEVEERGAAEDPELLAAALEAERALAEAYERGEPALLAELADASAERAAELERRLAALDAEQQAPPAVIDPAGGEEPAVEAQRRLLAEYREAAAVLSTAELRSLALGFVAEVATEQAVTRSLLGEDPAPRPFVTGREEQPLVADDASDNAGEEE